MYHPALFRQGSHPIFALTTLDYNAVEDSSKILATTQIDSLDVVAGKPVITSCRTFNTRFWSAADASIELTSTILAPGLPISKTLVGIGIGDQIAIWAGHGFGTAETIVPKPYDNMLRIFIGEVDNVRYQYTSTSIITTVKARCRMKYLLDSIIYYSPIQLQQLAKETASASQDRKSPDRFNRSAMIMEIAKLAVADSTLTAGATGQMATSQSTGVAIAGITIKESAFTQDLQGKETTVSLPADAWYQNGQPLNGQQAFYRQVPTLNPEFRIFTQRAPLSVLETSTFIVSQQVPIEMIKYLAMQEVYPTEVFQDQRDGNLYYAPRATDGSGLCNKWSFDGTKITYTGGDEARNHRVFFVACPEVDAAEPCSRILKYKEEESAVALKTNFFVEIGTATNTPSNPQMLHLATRPYKLRGKPMAARITAAVDPNITRPNEAAVVALMLARIWGKETRAATMTIMGDSSLTCGEAIQVVTPQRRDWNTDLGKFQEYNTRWNENLDKFAKAAASDATELDPSIVTQHDGSKLENFNVVTTADPNATQDINAPQDPLNNLTSEYFSKKNTAFIKGDGNGDLDSLAYGYNEDPESVYRVEAIIHKYNPSSGYNTEVMLISPF